MKEIGKEFAYFNSFAASCFGMLKLPLIFAKIHKNYRIAL